MPRFPSGILATAVIPWDDRGEFLEGLFVAQVRHMAAHLTPNLYVFGTACEGYAVTDTLFDRITRSFVGAMRAAGAEPMVGVISLSLPTIIERIALARDLGVRRFQLSLPAWGALADSEVETFFRETCGRYRDCQFLHYNLMRTKRLVTPAEYGRLAAAHPNLVATKNSTDSIDRVTELMRLAPDLTHFLNESVLPYASLLGECGLLASVALTNGGQCRRFFQACQGRDTVTATRLLAEIHGVTRALIGSVDGPARIDGAYDKMLWKLHDPRFPLRLLPPYEGASDDQFRRFAAALKDQYPAWLPASTVSG
jgi:dihydrodipicolinate synthase/N-acetylneuraminate lyase